jgi:hypothetical protein
MLSIWILSPVVTATPITYNRNASPIYDNYFAGTTYGIDMSDSHTQISSTNHPPGYGATTYPVNNTQLSGAVIAPDANYTCLTLGTTGDLVPSGIPDNIKTISHSQSFDNTTSWNDYGNPNPANYNYNLQVFALGGEYYTAHFYRYWDGSQWIYTPPKNATISYVEAVIRFAVGNGHINEGYFSVSYNDTVSLVNRGTWIQTSRYYEPHPNTIPNNTTNYWWNSSLVPYRQSQVFVDNGRICYRWDITPFYDWNVSMLQSDGLYIMWTTQQNWSATPMYIDYIGINYIYNTVLYNWTSIIEPIVTELSNQLESIVWLLLLYLPTIAITQYVPELGFVIGMALMLIVLTVYVGTSFLEVLFIGAGSIMIIMYKGA